MKGWFSRSPIFYKIIVNAFTTRCTLMLIPGRVKIYLLDLIAQDVKSLFVLGFERFAQARS